MIHCLMLFPMTAFRAGAVELVHGSAGEPCLMERL